MRAICVVTLLVAASCGTETSTPPAPAVDAATEVAVVPDAGIDAGTPIPADRPILAFDVLSGVASNAAAMPAAFSGAVETTCAKDTTRVFIGELFTHGIDDVQVLYEWAPVLPGAAQPTVAQPLLSLAGEIEHTNDSAEDLLFTHPFGFDHNADVKLDPAYLVLAHDRPTEDADRIHVELEQGLIAREAFDFFPKEGDRILMHGAWIFDCGHPPYETEVHPPTVVAYARAEDPKTTISLAFANPYRSSQLFNPDAALGPALADDGRFSDPESKPFPLHFLDEVIRAANGDIDQLEAHVLVEPTRFATLTWNVCAPLPRPEGATLDASWRFTSRTGVTVTAAEDEPSGCVVVTATMDGAYVPAPLARQDFAWPWDEMSAQASGQLGQKIDVRKSIIQVLGKLGFKNDIPALHADRAPIIDRYAALEPRPDAAMDRPTKVQPGADDQPYPFYGRVRVAWK